MSRGTDRLIKSAKQFADLQYKLFTARYGQQLIDIFEFPIKLVLSPFTLAFDIVGSAPRGFGVPELVSKLSYASIFAIATLGTYDIALEMGKKVICQRNCQTCNGWQALRCNMCKGAGKVHYQVKNYTLRSGEKATAECIADAIADSRAELVHLPSSMDLNMPLPSKDCPTCDGTFEPDVLLSHILNVLSGCNQFWFEMHMFTGVMSCPECKNKLQVRISADDIMEPPWQAYNVLRKMEYPYEARRILIMIYKQLRTFIVFHIVDSMRDPSIAAFWLFSFPEIMGGFNYDGDVKQKIWWQYKESMRYDQLRDVVAKRNPGWEHLQEALISIDPVRARDDPVVVKNVPYYKAKKTLETEVMKLDPPPRPHNWGVSIHCSLWLQTLMRVHILTNHFNRDPWGIRASREETVLVSISKVLPVPVTIPPTHALAVISAAATKTSSEYYAKKVKSGDPAELDLPLNASSWSEEDLKKPEKFYEMTVLLNAQREIADKILDSQWETKWRQEKLNEMLEEKVRPYIQNISNGALPRPILIPSQNQDNKVFFTGNLTADKAEAA
ncbi:hypothetical protein DKX38_025746 [Salix brachista]|uniref:AtTam37 zinc finger domain-containing protein n=1 Tax=Salix brachista TaxID=2182728 RepID=A0A5N5K2L3_9ROSI|nr:hypothetical protein DKX38_025746 [Salix brachista]